MDKLLCLLLWIDSVFSRTRDPVLAQHRSLQRHWLLSAGTVIITVVAEYYVASLVPAESSSRPMVQAVVELLSRALLVVTVVSFFWLTWATYALWRFERDFSY